MIEATDDIDFARDEERLGRSRRTLSRSASKGEARRIARGAYVPEETWRDATASERYLAQVAAVALTRRSPAVVSHWSAAAMHGLPRIGAWPTHIHFTVPVSASSGTKNGIVKHALPLVDDDIEVVAGIAVTSLTRTLLDIAATSTFRDAVVVADAALLVDRYGQRPPMVTREQLEAAWERAQPMRAHAKTKAVLQFAETRAETPIESVSRVSMRAIGVPRPVLQLAHYDSQGFIGETDFAWSDFGAVGEADGDQKYLDAAFRSGRTPEQVLLDEKHREDRLRALPRRVARWPWSVAVSPRLLRRRLEALGLPTGYHW
ncbi:MAG: hypothetical protein QOD50_1860 [Actinomycetota bacterium]|jgi:hypothetical protein|nr:hypothetical protein [Actinomycetota bacterium]